MKKNVKLSSSNKKKSKQLIIIGVIIFGALALAGLLYVINKDNIAIVVTEPVAKQIEDTVPAVKEDSAVSSNIKSQNDMLVYLIEEEKLAHDVYSVMFQKYGAQVFGNILDSEQTHQGKVLSLLQSRGIADPRNNAVGQFNDVSLQSLYDELIARGNTSTEEAYRVGVVIEETDIADITKQLATATESDIVTTLEALRKGSESHLRAFNRQLGKF